jgi:predicted dehydrogenase
MGAAGMTAGRRELGVAIIGAGMVGRAHAHGYRSLQTVVYPPPADLRLVAVADTNGALARDLAGRYDFARVTTSWEEIADNDAIDAVSVALPNHEHRPVVEGLLAAGKHVICEKPLAPTAGDAYAMLRTARETTAITMVGFNQRRAPGIAAIQQAIARSDFGRPRQFIGRYLTDYARSPEGPFTWRYQRSLAGGGALHDIGAHVIDMSRFLLGEIEAVEGAALTTFITERPIPAGHVVGHEQAVASGEFAPVDTDDVASFTLRFANGAVGEFSVSRIATGFRNSAGFTVIGERAAASFDTERFAEFGYFDATNDDALNGFRRVVTGPKHPHLQDALVMPVAGVGHGYAETFVAQAHEFVHAIVSGDQPRPDFADGYANVLVCEAVQRAAAQGRRVAIAEIAAEIEPAASSKQ